MDPAMQRVGTWLQSTLLPDKATREAAEQALRLSELEPGHVVLLLKLAVDTSLPIEPVLRQCAVTYMKNVIKQRWDPPEPPPHRKNEGRTEPLTEADKAVVRSNLVEAIAVSVPAVRAQLALCLRSIAMTDYPDRWPELLNVICASLSAADEPHLHGGLLSLRVLAKIFEYRRDGHSKNAIVAASFPTLMPLLRNLLAAPPTVKAAEMALLAAKVIHSCVCYELPTLLLSPAAMEPFFELLLALLSQPLPADEAPPADPADLGSWPPWKLKKRVAQSLHRMLQRHGNPKKSNDPDKLAKGQGAAEQAAAQQQAAAVAGFARAFQDHYSGRILQGFMELHTQCLRGKGLPPRVHTLCLNYIEEASKYKNTYVFALKPQLQQLFDEVIYPPLCFQQEDADLWEEDPHEFVRRTFDVIEEFYSPRTAAQRLLVTLVEKRTKDCLHGIVVACSAVLTKSQGSADEALLRQKDGALLALGSIEKALTKKGGPYAASLEPMLRTHVLPALSSPCGFLRLRATWLYSAFTPSVFRGGDGATAEAHEQIGQVFPALMGLMRDASLPVRVQAALTIKELVEARCVPDAVLGVLPQLLECLFSLVQEVGADEIVATLDTLIEHYGEQMAPYSVQVVTALVSSFLQLSEDANGEDDNGDAVLAAMGVLQALTTMCEAVHNMGDRATPLFAALEAPLLPLFRVCLQSEEGDDYIDEALEVLSYLTYHATEVSPHMWELLPLLHDAFHNWARDYLNSMAAPIDNLISRSPHAFLTLNEGLYVTQVVSICRAALVGEESAHMEESDLHGAPQLLESILTNCRGRVDPIVPDIVALTLMSLDKAEKEPLKVLLHVVLSSCLHYDARLTLAALEHRQATQTALTAWFTHLTTCEKLRVRDIKLGFLGCSALLALPNEAAPPMISGNRLLLLRLAAALIKKGEAAKAKRDAEAAEDGDDDDDDEEDEDEDGELGDDDEGEDEEKARDGVLARLLKSEGKNFFDDFEDSDDELSDDETHESVIDSVDEMSAFAQAAHAAVSQDAALLARAGLQPTAGVAAELGQEEIGLLSKVLQGR